MIEKISEREALVFLTYYEICGSFWMQLPFRIPDWVCDLLGKYYAQKATRRYEAAKKHWKGSNYYETLRKSAFTRDNGSESC